MERVADAGPLEHQVGLGVLVGERIRGDAVMVEQRLDSHSLPLITRIRTIIPIRMTPRAQEHHQHPRALRVFDPRSM